MRIRMLITVVILLAGSRAARADERPVTAASVVSLANAAARAWADDADLVYLENDRDVTADGTATRWGLLYWSASRDEARAYSMREGKVQRAEDLEFDFAAPPVADEWIDSDEAVRRAFDAGGKDYLARAGGRLRSALLVRGVMHLDDPQRTTWTCVYDAPEQPSLWVVLDAESGKVLAKWKG